MGEFCQEFASMHSTLQTRILSVCGSCSWSPHLQSYSQSSSCPSCQQIWIKGMTTGDIGFVVLSFCHVLLVDLAGLCSASSKLSSLCEHVCAFSRLTPLNSNFVQSGT